MDESDGELLPCDLLMEILSRLPGKTLMRFKCVSKRWFSLITDPIFAELHNTRSLNREDGGIFVTPASVTGDCLMCIVDMKKEPLERVSVFEPSISYRSNRNTNIVNGLICYYYRSHERGLIYLYNITTRETISLPLTQIEDLLRTSPMKFVRRCLLGFDPTNKEYKVLHFYKQWDRKQKCEVFTIGCPKKMWRPLDMSQIQHFGFPCSDAFCDDGFLYWTRPNVMILFDVRLEIFKVVHFPEEKLCYSWKSVLVKDKVEDCLLLVALCDKLRKVSEIIWWRFKEDGDTGEPKWTKEVVTCGLRRLEPRCVNHHGQMFSARSPHLNRSIIDYYDIVTGKQLEFEVNNPRGILWRVCSYWAATEVIDNIMPLHLLSN